MTRLGRRYFLALWGLVCFATLTWSQWLMFKAGCVGDVKGGALGDPVLALDIESQAVLVELTGLLLTSVLVSYLCRKTRSGAVASGIAFFFFSFVVLGFVGVFTEAKGVSSCLVAW